MRKWKCPTCTTKCGKQPLIKIEYKQKAVHFCVNCFVLRPKRCRQPLVELTGLAPVYQRKPTKLSPYTVCFCCHTTKKANKLAVSRHLRVSVTIGAPAECYLFAKSDADHLASQRSQGPRAGLNYAAYAIP